MTDQEPTGETSLADEQNLGDETTFDPMEQDSKETSTKVSNEGGGDPNPLDRNADKNEAKLMDGSESNKTSENLQGNYVDGPVGSKQSEMAEIEPAVDYAAVQDDSKETASMKGKEEGIRDDSYQGADNEGHQTDHHQNDFNKPIECQDDQEGVDMTKTELIIELQDELTEAKEMARDIKMSSELCSERGRAQQQLLEIPTSRRKDKSSKQNSEPINRLEHENKDRSRKRVHSKSTSSSKDCDKKGSKSSKDDHASDHKAHPSKKDPEAKTKSSVSQETSKPSREHASSDKKTKPKAEKSGLQKLLDGVTPDPKKGAKPGMIMKYCSATPTKR